MKTILITGATGLIGQEIVEICHSRGWRVNYLTTSKSKLEDNNNYQGYYWNPSNSEIDIKAFENVETIINLAGAPIAERWTDTYKKELISSRVDSLELIRKTLKSLDHSVQHLVSASAIGYYPDSETEYYDEGMTNDHDNFIIEVVRKWEAAATQFETLGIKVAKLRIGIVLSDDGGALEKLIKPIKAYVGSPLGSGKQWQSWIHIRDLANMFLHVLDENLEGVFNAVAPNPVIQSNLVKTLANQLNRPIILPAVPEFVLKLVLGEMHVIVTASQRVSSKKIEDTGFIFEFHHLEQALTDLFDK